MNDETIVLHRSEHRQLLNANRYAATVVFNILDQHLDINSVLDLGCGIGTWMQIAVQKPGRSALGVELEEYAAADLLVSSDTVISTSIAYAFDLHRRFDLALCLETAEHIDEEFARNIVDNCVRHANIVLFSAALPGQGGLHHINEQPAEYWEALFNERDYELIDLIRSLIWHDSRVPTWYRQNMLLFVARSMTDTVSRLKSEAACARPAISRAHPDLFLYHANQLAACSAELHQVRSELSAARVEIERTRAEVESATAQGIEHAASAAAAQERHLQLTTALQQQLADLLAEREQAVQRAQALELEIIEQREYARRSLSKLWRTLTDLQNEQEVERARVHAAQSALQQQLADATRQTEQLSTRNQQESEQWNELNRQLLRSRSWRVTAPLRAVHIGLRGVSKRIRIRR